MLRTGNWGLFFLILFLSFPALTQVSASEVQSKEQSKKLKDQTAEKGKTSLIKSGENQKTSTKNKPSKDSVPVNQSSGTDSQNSSQMPQQENNSEQHTSHQTEKAVEQSGKPSETLKTGDTNFKSVDLAGSEYDKDWIFSNEMKRPNKRRSSIFGFPILSFAVPGLGQFMNGQNGAGWVYSSAAAAGAGLGISGLVELNERFDDDDENEELEGFESSDPAARRFLVGASIYQLAGSLSLYHSFQTVVNFRQEEGDFQFLPKERETTDELMLAPFEFGFMGRWTTFVPLIGLLGLVFTSGVHDDYNTRDSLNAGDYTIIGTLSYGAGVGEEAMFRGWLFPVFIHAYGEDNMFWANVTQGAIFGALHLSRDNPLPLFQALGGYYAGWMVKRNGWSLREAIFLHTWWDIIAFSALLSQGDKRASLYIPIYQTQF